MEDHKSKKKPAYGYQITQEKWDLALQSFRDATPPLRGAFKLCTQNAKIDHKTAKKLWERPCQYLGQPPIKEIIAEEQLATRAGVIDAIEAAAHDQTAAQQDRAYHEAEKSRADVIKARRQEAEMVRAQRGNLMALISVTGRVLRGIIKRATVLEKALAEGVDPATGKPLTLKAQIDMMWKVNRMVSQTATASADVIKMERLLLGEPTEIVGTMDIGDMSEEQAMKEIREAYEAANRVASRKDFIVMPETKGPKKVH